MLALTNTALEVVKHITSAEGASDQTGLRIAAAAQEDHEGALELSVVTAPAENDQVLAGEGARIYLDEGAASYLDDKVLDAQVDEEGNANFALAEQDPESGTQA